MNEHDETIYFINKALGSNAFLTMKSWIEIERFEEATIRIADSLDGHILRSSLAQRIPDNF